MIKHCEVCKCNIQICLHQHHTALMGNRKEGYQGEVVTLCANCHEIIHQWLGGKSKQKGKVLTRRGTIQIIHNILLKTKKLNLPYWFYSIQSIQNQIDNERNTINHK